jgi:hypothetical protein
MPPALVAAIFFSRYTEHLKRNFYEIELQSTYETTSLQKSPKVFDPLTTFFAGMINHITYQNLPKCLCMAYKRWRAIFSL